MGPPPYTQGKFCLSTLHSAESNPVRVLLCIEINPFNKSHLHSPLDWNLSFFEFLDTLDQLFPGGKNIMLQKGKLFFALLDF